MKKSNNKNENKERNGKKIIIILIITIVVASIVLFIKISEDGKMSKNSKNNIENQEEFVSKLKDGKRVNTSEKLKTIKELEGMLVSNPKLTEKENITVFTANVTNKSDSRQGGFKVEVKLKDINKNDIKSLTGYIKALEPSESTQLDITTSMDYANAYDYTINKKD